MKRFTLWSNWLLVSYRPAFEFWLCHHFLQVAGHKLRCTSHNILYFYVFSDSQGSVHTVSDFLGTKVSADSLGWQERGGLRSWVSLSVLTGIPLKSLCFWTSLVVQCMCQCRGPGFDLWPGNILHTAGQLSPCAITTEPTFQRTRAPQQEETRTQQLESSPHSLQQERAHGQQRRPSTAK